MPKPTNKKLYEKVKGQIQRQLKAKGQRWSARASQQLVNEYKKQGGKYSGSKANSSLTNWPELCRYHWPVWIIQNQRWQTVSMFTKNQSTIIEQITTISNGQKEIKESKCRCKKY